MTCGILYVADDNAYDVGMNLEPCPSCDRHVRGDTCPFCAAKLSPSLEPQRNTHLATRAAFLIGSVALAAGCNTISAAYGGPPEPPIPLTATVAPSTPRIADVDAAPPPPASAKKMSPETPPGPAPAYGAPPPTKK